MQILECSDSSVYDEHRALDIKTKGKKRGRQRPSVRERGDKETDISVFISTFLESVLFFFLEMEYFPPHASLTHTSCYS